MIRIAELADVDHIYSIEKLSFEHPWSKSHFLNDIQNKYSKNWVWTENNRIVAYLFGHLIVDEYHLHNIAVSNEYRKKGIALKLMEKMLNFSKENKVKAVFLEVSSSNLPACKLYEKKGFVAQGIRKKYYPNGDDALLYTLILS